MTAKSGKQVCLEKLNHLRVIKALVTSKHWDGQTLEKYHDFFLAGAKVVKSEQYDQEKTLMKLRLTWRLRSSRSQMFFKEGVL